jgi:tetratricopeptide (TPR) repeat protein
MMNRGGRVGIDPVSRIETMENHDAAYHIWRDAGVKQRTLIHIDAHHDMWWTADAATITIANFISRALAEGIVREVFWVVSDKTWETAKTRRPVLGHLRKIAEEYPGARDDVRIEKNRLSAVVLDKPLTVCPLAGLPRMDESVLLDIDVDFLVIPRVSCVEHFPVRLFDFIDENDGVPALANADAADERGALPWCWPAELVARLRGAAVRTDLMTIAYSVEGGFTPLKWKYLGDDLAERVAAPEERRSAIHGMDLMREAALAAERGDVGGAEGRYREATTILSRSAAPWYHLAHLLNDSGRRREARSLYRQALGVDPSYRTPFNGAGFARYRAGHFLAAEKEFRRVLQLDPQDAYALLGLGLIAFQRNRLRPSAALLRAALVLDDSLVDGHRALGHVLARLGCVENAIAAYERSLRLSLAGFKSLESPIAAGTRPDRVVDPDHWFVHGCLAQLYEARGATTHAINGYRISIAGGHDGMRLQGRLARLTLKQGDWQSAWGHLWQLLQLSPGELMKIPLRLPQLCRRIRRMRRGRKLAGGSAK